MSGCLNKVQLIGYLGRDPDVRSTESGKKVVTLNIATSESWRDASGNRVERTEWHRVVIWNEALGDIAEKYLAKGSRVYVEGKLATRKWEDQSGNDRYSTEINIQPYNGTLTFLDPAPDKRERPPGGSLPSSGRSGSDIPKGGDLDDTIPF
ncbi:MAG: single-stranded DNA-binding protein [Planctomycetaceae bacterium]|nr:single-stranded DNA-binding protein [Planctomycetaceae bacterium]